MNTKAYQAITFNNVNHEMRTLSGKKLDLLAPVSSMIDIKDIASGLANNSHFAGQTPYFFSIAQHCIMVCDEYCLQNPDASDSMKLLALMHDAPEAYVGDVIKPLKNLLPDYVEIERKIMNAIASRFELPVLALPEIKSYDLWAQNVEYNAFYRGAEINYLDPEAARRVFLDRFCEFYPGPNAQ